MLRPHQQSAAILPVTADLKGHQTKIFVGNVSSETCEEDLQEAFSAFGEVTSITVLSYRDTGEPRGSAFVEMPDKAQAKSAITHLNYGMIRGRRIILKEAHDQTEGALASSAPRDDIPAWT